MIISLCCNAPVGLLENGCFRCAKCWKEQTATLSTDTGKNVTQDQRLKLREALKDEEQPLCL